MSTKKSPNMSYLVIYIEIKVINSLRIIYCEMPYIYSCYLIQFFLSMQVQFLYFKSMLIFFLSSFNPNPESWLKKTKIN